MQGYPGALTRVNSDNILIRMTEETINLVKLSVGSESVDGLAEWQKTPAAQGPDGLPRHITRMWPRREAGLVNGGSVYWVIRGAIRARQRVLRLDEVTGADGIRRCAIVLDPALIRTRTAPRRPFQGWRYLKPGDSPADLRDGEEQDSALPPGLSEALAEIGVF